MGTASLIAASIAILLLVITAYVLIGGTIATAEVVMSAQREAASSNADQIRTGITIMGTLTDAPSSVIYITVENSGNVPVTDFDHMDLFLAQGGFPVHYHYGTDANSWSLVSIEPDDIHPRQLDPDETMNISVAFGSEVPTWIQVATSNGICDSAYVGD